MSEFTAEWLGLRAPADDRARAKRLHAMIRNYFEDRDTIRILDIGAGTGSSVTLFAEMPGPKQDWLLVDRDPVLLAIAGGRERAPHQTVDTRVVDLAEDLETLFDPKPNLVTAQAFFDLTSPGWTRQFVERLAASGAALYAPLIYDGMELWEPPHSMDHGVLGALHLDMSEDKGFGPAMGPEATGVLSDMLEDAGYSVWTMPSPWQLDPEDDGDLIKALATGTGQAVKPHLGPIGTHWAEVRQTAERVTIGHQDIFAVPAE